MTLESNRLINAFAELRLAGRKTLLPFITAGFPSLDATEAVLHEFDRLGLRICELGVPFTDPIADGPVIQASYTEALAAGVTTTGLLEMVRRYRQAGGKLALLAMVSYSIVFKRGGGAFAAAAAEAGIDGLIIPDLPLDESGEMEASAEAAGVALVQLIAPTTADDRRVEIARRSRGFIYLMSLAGVTGERTALPPETIERVAELRKLTETPVCVGFGISNAETVANVCDAADGAIVGSAIVHRIADKKNAAPEEIAACVGEFVKELVAPLV